MLSSTTQEIDEAVMQVGDPSGMFVHRIALVGDAAECDAMAGRMTRRASTAWGPSDAVLRRLGEGFRRGMGHDAARASLAAALAEETGYGLDEVVEAMDPFDRLVLSDPARSPSTAGRGDPADPDAFVVETCLPGPSLASLRPVPHRIASWGADPVGRLWRRDNWGTDAEILPLGVGFAADRTRDGRRYAEFAAHSSMPLSAFLAASRRMRRIVIVVTGQMASVRDVGARAEAGGAIRCAAAAFCAGETVTSEIVDVSGSSDIRRAAAYDPEGAVRGVLAGVEDLLVGKFDLG